MDDKELSYAARAIRAAGSVVAMTGAGVSTASGIPDFRSADGLWQEYDPEDFHISRFQADPEGFWRERLEVVDDLFGTDVEPNAAHHALARLESTGHLEALITQNVDGLHQAAGSEDPIELHGNARRVVCTGCRQRRDAEPVFERVRDGEVPPTCRDCGDILKPDVVLFGEQLPEYAHFRAHALAEGADVFLVAGSSLAVEPAASLPETAADRGATIVLVNRDPTELSGQAEYDFRADVTDVLPALVDRITESA